MSQVCSPLPISLLVIECECVPHASKLCCLNNKLTRHFVFPMTDTRHKALQVIWNRERIRVGRKVLGREDHILSLLTSYNAQVDTQQVRKIVWQRKSNNFQNYILYLFFNKYSSGILLYFSQTLGERCQAQQSCICIFCKIWGNAGVLCSSEVRIAAAESAKSR